LELVLFIGVQASGKSTFYQQQFFHTHVRISLDLLRTRHRERQFLETCLRTRQRAVIDNTNPTRVERKEYIDASRDAGFQVIGYYFQSLVQDCKQRNEQRGPEHRVPLRGLLGTYTRLELPARSEGFNQLYFVRQIGGGFAVEEWQDEI